MTADERAATWIKAGFAELAKTGVEGVRVEVLAKNLGVTKGGFYRRFKDRAALLTGMLAEWSAGRIAAIELAIRQWARTDEAAAEAVASVDAARLKNVAQLYRATGLEAEDADAKAFLFYCFVFGQSLLFLERGQRRRTQLLAKSAEALLGDS